MAAAATKTYIGSYAYRERVLRYIETELMLSYERKVDHGHEDYENYFTCEHDEGSYICYCAVKFQEEQLQSYTKQLTNTGVVNVELDEWNSDALCFGGHPGCYRDETPDGCPYYDDIHNRTPDEEEDEEEDEECMFELPTEGTTIELVLKPKESSDNEHMIVRIRFAMSDCGVVTHSILDVSHMRDLSENDE